MSNETLELTAVANVKPLIGDLNDAGNSVKKFATQSQQSFNTVAKSSLQAGAAIAKGSNQAAQATVNLGRVAQDLPFGFIGIQNNLNHLLESFQRLKAETGSTGGAFKALAGSLAGPAGVGLALSVVSGAILIAQNGISGLKNIFKSTAEQITQSTVDIANFKREIEDSKRAVAEFNEELAQSGKLSKIRLQISFADKNKSDLIGLQQDFISTGETFVFLQKELNRLSNVSGQAFSNFLSNASKAARDIELKFGGIEYIPESALSKLEEADKELIKSAVDAAKALNKVNEDINKNEQNRSVVIAQNALLRTNIAREEVAKAKEIAKENAKNYEDSQKQLTNIFRKWRKMRSEENPLPPEVQPEYAKDAFNQEFFDKFLSPAQYELNNKPLFVPIQIKTTGLENLTKREDFLKSKEAAEKSLTEMFSGFGNTIFEALGQSIGSGGDIFGSLFGNIFNQFGEGLVKLGKYAIEYSVLGQKIKEALSIGNFGTGIALGIGLIALGTLMKAQQKQVPGFATGVQNFQGGVAMVGERGPELVNLPRGADVIPNYQLAQNSIGGGQTLELTGEFVLRNDSLVMAVRRGTKTMIKTG